MRTDNVGNVKTSFTCPKSGKKLKPQIPNSEKSKTGPPKNAGEEIQNVFTGKLKRKHLTSFVFILVVVDKNSWWPVAHIFKNTNYDTLGTILRNYMIVYGISKSINLDKGSAFFSKGCKRFVTNIKFSDITAEQNHTPTRDWLIEPSNH